MSLFRAAILGDAADTLGPALASALLAADRRVRVVRPWHAREQAWPERAERVVADDAPGALMEALRGCNELYLFPPILAAGALASRLDLAVAWTTRALDEARQAGVDRALWCGSAITVAPTPGQPLSDWRGAYLPGSGGGDLAEVCFAAEREAYRFAADAMHLSFLLAPLTLRFDDQPKLPRRLRDDAPLNVISQSALVRTLVNARAEARPGHRYLLGGVNTTVGALRAALTAPTRSLTPLELALIQRGQHLDSARAIAELGHQPLPSLSALIT